MKKLLLATVFAAVIASPAFAEQYTLVKDTVGNCSAVVHGSHYAGMEVMSSEAYSSMEAANKALDGLKDCSGLVR